MYVHKSKRTVPICQRVVGCSVDKHCERTQVLTPDYLRFSPLRHGTPGKETDAVAFQMVDQNEFLDRSMIRQMISRLPWVCRIKRQESPIRLNESNSVFGRSRQNEYVSLTSALYLALCNGVHYAPVRETRQHMFGGMFTRCLPHRR